MVLDLGSSDPPAEPDQVFDALADDACREIVAELEEPMTVQEIADAADVPLSTTYRKLERLEDASLVDERLELRSGGHHRTRYVLHFDRVIVELDDTRVFRIDLERPMADPERQFATIWSEVRQET